jgi:hypothetical protein
LRFSTTTPIDVGSSSAADFFLTMIGSRSAKATK